MYKGLRKNSDYNDIVKECMSMSSVEVSGIPVAADYRVEVRLEAKKLGVTRSAPFLLDYLATGLALSRGKIMCGGYVGVERVEKLGKTGIIVYGTTMRMRGERCVEKPERLSLRLLNSIYRDFSTRLPKRGCPIAVHRLAFYTLGSRGHVFRFFVVDPSRHAAAYKLAGIISALSSKLPNEPGVVVSTGRLSDDMVRALSRAGIRVVISFHHPLLSGLLEAKKLGVTLALQDPHTGKLRAFGGNTPVDE
ncbi:hypothetical protein PYJP_00630 [Pyrofollis japonicus]|nr:hypothetical protein PYJP_00630 [Pyrofollis japonicus]